MSSPEKNLEISAMPYPNTILLRYARGIQKIEEIGEIVKHKPPYLYFVEIDHSKEEIRLGSEPKQESIDAISVLAGEISHNFRSAIDQAYYAIVSPHVTKKGQERRIQFPSGINREAYFQDVKNRLAPLAGENFEKTVRELENHGAPGGNLPLYALSQLNNEEKHVRSVKIGYSTVLNPGRLDKIIPGLSNYLPNLGGITLGNNKYDASMTFSAKRSQQDTSHRHFAKVKINRYYVPIDINTTMEIHQKFAPMGIIRKLRDIAESCSKTLEAMEPFFPPSDMR